MWRVVALAAISVSAYLVELWFRGYLLGISFLCFSFFLVVFGVGGTGLVRGGEFVLYAVVLTEGGELCSELRFPV